MVPVALDGRATVDQVGHDGQEPHSHHTTDPRDVDRILEEIRLAVGLAFLHDVANFLQNLDICNEKK